MEKHHRTNHGDQNWKWYGDKQLLVALISGFFSTLITIINVLLKK